MGDAEQEEKPMTRKLALLILAGALFGCVTEDIVEAKPGAAKIKVVRESDKPLKCTTLADVHGVSRSRSEEKARAGAENDIKNRASAFKANYVLVDVDRVKPIGTSPYREIFLGGKALACED
jgi:hypothetical protein